MEIHDDCLYKSMLKIPIPNTKPNIKDCLQLKEITQFEKLMLEIRSNFILKISDKEPGRSSFETSNIPSHIDPIFTSFGTRQRDPFSLSDIIHDTYNYDFNSRTIKYPGEQLDRKYKKPFSKYKIYGKVTRGDVSGDRVKKLLYSFKEPRKFTHFDVK